MSPHAHLSLTLPSSPDTTAMARQAARTFEPLLEPRRAPDLSLLVSEVVTNGVRHADAPDGSSIALEVSVEGDVLRAEVVDAGHGFEPDLPAEPEPEVPGGWGLYLVDKLADRWGVADTGGTRVWFEFDRARPRPPRQDARTGVAWAAPSGRAETREPISR